MKQADKSDKSHLTFGSSTFDDEKIIKVVDHGVKIKPQRAIMRTIALEGRLKIDGAQKRPKESQLST